MHSQKNPELTGSGVLNYFINKTQLDYIVAVAIALASFLWRIVLTANPIIIRVIIVSCVYCDSKMRRVGTRKKPELRNGGFRLISGWGFKI